MGAFPPIDELIPHRRPMLLLDEVLEQEGISIVTQTTVREDMFFVQDGELPMMVAIELFAQSAAAMLSLRAQRGSTVDIRSGALLGTRKIELLEPACRVGDVLTTHCEEAIAVGPTAQIECKLLRDGVVVARGSINVMAGAL